MLPLIVSIAYGYEHAVYPRAKNLWSIYRDHFSDIRVVFLKSSESLAPDEYIYSEGEYTFGKGHGFPADNLSGMSPFDAQGFTIDRSLKFYKKLLSDIDQPFWLYHSTVTSAVDFRVIRYLVNQLECRKTFAGSLLYAKIPENLSDDMPAGKTFRMISGSGVLLSSDLLELILKRQNDVPHNQLNDVWVSLVLRDIPRIPLLRADILDIFNYDETVRLDLMERVNGLLRSGHFSFRVKSGRWEESKGTRLAPEMVDVLVINDILLSLLSRKPLIQEAMEGWDRLKASLCDLNGSAMLPIA